MSGGIWICNVFMSSCMTFAFNYSLLLGHVHITDFGLAKRLKKGQRTNTICGTLQYIGQTDTTFFDINSNL